MANPPAAALKAEILSGPHAAVFAGWVAAGAHTPIADWLDDPAGPAAATIALESVGRNDFLLALRPAYLTLPALAAGVQAKWDRILDALNTTTEAVAVDATTQFLLGQAVADGVLTQAQADAAWHRAGSYAEAAWGSGVSITHADVSAALNS